MAPPKEVDSLKALQNTISNLKSLLRRFQTALQPTDAYPHSKDSPNPLAVLSDASQILKAQTTKLSLLILNKPFTPSAISFILNSLQNNCLPALMSALELCPAAQYTNIIQQCVRVSLSRIMMELLCLLDLIPQDGHKDEQTTSRETLASTGRLWAECDKMVALGLEGLTNISAKRVEEYHDLMKDAIAELEQWDPNEDSESDTDSATSDQGDLLSRGPVNPSLEQSLQDLSLSPIAVLRQRTLATLRIVRVLYPALVKRRILTFPNITSTTPAESLPLPSHIQSLDELVYSIKRFTEEVDEVAGALYAGGELDAEDRLTTVAEISKTCVIRLRLGWGGNEDEFTSWAEKWMARLEEVRGS